MQFENIVYLLVDKQAFNGNYLFIFIVNELLSHELIMKHRSFSRI